VLRVEARYRRRTSERAFGIQEEEQKKIAGQTGDRIQPILHPTNEGRTRKQVNLKEKSRAMCADVR